MSGLDRDASEFGLPDNLVELDIFTGVGDGGCPVFNQAGEVAGMTLAAATTNDKYAGAGFALPLNTKILLNSFKDKQLKILLDSYYE